jgi:cell division protein FtsZ
MIQLSRNYSLPEREEQIIPIKVIAVGSAGSNTLDRVVLDGMDKSDLIAANTDAQSLASSVAAVKVQLGRSITRGLGTGGDPELGFDAAQDAADEIRQVLTQARLIFICAGLGGGTGSGAAPVIAQIAREIGALVIAFATLPFTFEGKRRAAQARDALARLHEFTDAVVCFENDRMADMVAPKAGIHQAFAVADMTISQSLRSIVNLIQRPGIMRIGFDDLLAALRGGGGRCLFGFGESDSDNRAHQALTQALKNPLMDRGRSLANAASVLVQITGGPGMTLSEVEILMRDLNKHIGEETQLLFGTAVDGRMGDRLSVTLLSSLPVEAVAGVAAAVRVSGSDPGSTTPATTTYQSRKPKRPVIATPPAPQPVIETVAEPTIESLVESEARNIPVAIEPEPAQPVMQEPEISQSESVIEEENLPPREMTEATPLVETQMEENPPPQPPTPRIIPPKKKPLMAPKVEPENPKREKAAARQEILQFEPVTRGRFEKSEPTIVEGQDLDVPTFLRKNIRVK